MRISRLYQPIKLISGETVSLTPEAAHYLVNVLRLSVGEKIKIFNGEGGEFSATVFSINKQKISVKIGEYLVHEVESPLQIHLGQAISRGEKMDYTIQKAVELGVTQITPLFTERCGVKLSQERWEKRLQHWRSIIISACEQSGRNTIPIIHEPIVLTEWLKKINTDYKIMLHPEGSMDCFAGARNDDIKSIALLVGPEGGFAEAEVAYAIQQGFSGMKLGPRILRTETAALAIIAILQAKFGDMT